MAMSQPADATSSTGSQSAADLIPRVVTGCMFRSPKGFIRLLGVLRFLTPHRRFRDMLRHGLDIASAQTVRTAGSTPV
jgi:hypothetical protein